jgi:hypothetical protein
MHASLWLDISVLLRTFIAMVLGEKTNGEPVKAAHAGLEKMGTKKAVESGPTTNVPLLAQKTP